LSDVLVYDKELRKRQDEGLAILAEEAQKLNLGY